MTRLFLAVELPPALRKQLAQLDPHIENLRWVSEENLHLTLLFLGALPTEIEHELRTALAALRVAPARVSVETMGTFRNPGGTIVWAGIPNPPAHLLELQRQLRDTAAALGISVEKRAYKPHITVARSRTRLPTQFRAWLRGHEQEVFGSFEIQQVTLFSSRMEKHGPIYTSEGRYPASE